MLFHENHLYHIYNRGNNQQQLFYHRDNYLLFLQNIRKFILPTTDILAWCLMPNNFHLLIHANEKTTEIVKKQPLAINAVTEAIRLTLSSYTKALQKQQNFTGSLFQQKTKGKCIADGSVNYGPTTFHYIHQNPYTAKLVTNIEDWEFSSFRDYLGYRNGDLCNKELAQKLLDLNFKTLLVETYQVIPVEQMSLILKTGW